MSIYSDSFAAAFGLLATGDSDLMEILYLSINVSVLSLALSCSIGLPIGAILAIRQFHGRDALVGIFNALMGLPPVVVGLLVYLHLSRSGPFGWLGLLYTPQAMVIAQMILITPIIIALSCQILADMHEGYKDFFDSLVVPKRAALFAYIVDAR